MASLRSSFFFFQAEDGIRDKLVTGVQTCALPIYVARDLAVGEDQHVDLGQDRADHALDAPRSLDAGRGRTRGGELALEVPCPESPGDVPAADADDERQVDQDDGLPRAHQCTCSSGTGACTFSSLSCPISASSAFISVAAPLPWLIARM